MDTSSHAHAPFWGAQTSYLNFCEEDYAITRYIAEFINTLSSITFILYGLYGLLYTRQRKNARSPVLLYYGLIGIGVCSGGYHMTLKYHTQMSDELSMHLLTTPLVYRLLTFNATPEKTRLVGIVLTILFTVVMVTHMVMDEFLLHATTFALAIYVIVTRSRRIIPQQCPDPKVRKSIQNVSTFGLVCFAAGYSVWLVDQYVCNVLIDTRRSVGLPLAFLLELHGWWHVLTAIGGYVAVATVDLITSGELVLKDPSDQLAWPVPLAARLMSGKTRTTKEHK
ncbi:unnamed protein product [Clonostachys chloroleuca]|uniref:Alkaline phytoceramidase n=1 Tax=Clonostachys chloroleuca TaxID=1926264 RepID=A0AA35PZA3_9HYPO|nr:unnamed protein product [Clonostachys chloroleuca]